MESQGTKQHNKVNHRAGNAAEGLHMREHLLSPHGGHMDVRGQAGAMANTAQKATVRAETNMREVAADLVLTGIVQQL